MHYCLAEFLFTQQNKCEMSYIILLIFNLCINMYDFYSIIIYFRDEDCRRCLVITEKHQNVIQYKESEFCIIHYLFFN
jgi:hypothetical protein